MKVLVFLIFFILTGNVISQVLNIDREIESDTIFRRVRANFNFTFSNDKQKENLLDFSNVSEIDYFLKKKYLFVFLTKTELSFNGVTALENNGFFQLRFRDNDSRKISPDIFAQYQWNSVQGIESRSLAGINVRMRWLEKRKSDLYTGLGVFYEAEKWNPFLSAYAFPIGSQGIINRNIFRLNLAAKFALKIGENIDFVGASFVQFPINSHFTTPRWFFDSNLFFTVNKHLEFTIHYDHNLDSYRPLPIENYYYSVSTGINIKF